MTAATAGGTATLDLEWFNEESGTLTDPDGLIQADITYGSEAGLTADVTGGGPFTWTGASSPSPNTVYRTGTGTYSFLWLVPTAAPTGVYTITWSVTFQGDTYPVVENFAVTGSGPVPVPSGDTGFWTGSLAYTPAAGTPSAPVTISFGTGPDASGISWIWNKITGWDGPDVQGGGVLPKSGDHGAWATPQYYAARQLTLNVTLSAPSQALRDVGKQLLQQAVPISDVALLTYDEPVPKQVLVRRSGKLTETPLTLRDSQFSIGLVAPDPRKYSTQLKSIPFNAAPATGGGVTMPIVLPMVLPPLAPGGSVACDNEGTFETRPVIVVTGPIVNPALINVTTGQTVSWTGLTLQSGDVLAVDFGLMQATLNGSYRPADPFSSWWTLPPGVSTVAIQGQSDAGAGVVVNFSNAWI